MYKKLFSSIFLAVTLMFFVSCQQKGDKKKDDQKKTSSYQRNNRKGTYQRGKPAKDSKMPAGKKCPEPCPKKTCPSGCKKKCCVNEQEDPVLQEKQEIISLQDLTNKGLPLEELKAAIENDSLEIE